MLPHKLSWVYPGVSWGYPGGYPKGVPWGRPQGDPGGEPRGNSRGGIPGGDPKVCPPGGYGSWVMGFGLWVTVYGLRESGLGSRSTPNLGFEPDSKPGWILGARAPKPKIIEMKPLKPA
jgi:hypothetical protein